MSAASAEVLLPLLNAAFVACDEDVEHLFLRCTRAARTWASMGFDEHEIGTLSSFEDLWSITILDSTTHPRSI